MDLRGLPTVLAKGIRMNEAEFDQEFSVEDITKAIVDQAKAEVKSRFGNKKRHRQWTALYVIYLKSQSGSGKHTRQWVMERFGALMPKDPKVMSMDWRSLGYWPVWKDGKKVWVPQVVSEDSDWGIYSSY